MEKLANKLSRKQVEAYANGDWPDNFHDGIKEMALVLLAMMDAKPVGYIDPESLKEYRGHVAGGSWSALPKAGEYNQTMPIYDTPLLLSSPLDDFVNREDYYQRCEIAPHREY